MNSLLPRFVFLLLLSSFAAAQNELPRPTILSSGGDARGVQFSHAFSLSLRPDYCYHSFVMAYDQDTILKDIALKLHFGSGGSRVAVADLAFASLGGTFIDDRHLAFGYNATCRIDEVRVVEFNAMDGETAVGLASGLILTMPILSQMAVTRGLPIPEGGAGDFRSANLEGEGQVKCLSNGGNLRAGPSTNDAIVTTLRASSDNRIPVTILGQVAGSNWFEVESPGGRGYLFGRLLGPC